MFLLKNEGAGVTAAAGVAAGVALDEAAESALCGVIAGAAGLADDGSGVCCANGKGMGWSDARFFDDAHEVKTVNIPNGTRTFL